MNIKKNIPFQLSFVVVLSVLLMISACSQIKNKPLYRGWHNMNARFNGYFYSDLTIKETVTKLEKANKDDFTKIIPLFIYPDNQSAKTYYADFDKSIKKSSVVIQRHTIKNKRTKLEIPNACRWIDENWMLIGKSHFYKRDLFSALEAFEYVSKIYPNPKAKYGALLWMIRTNNEIGSFSQSQAIMDQIRNAKDFPKDKSYIRELASVSADYDIKTGDYASGIRDLTKAITLTHKKTIKARYTFVLAQLYQKVGDNKSAAIFFAMVPGLHPSYEMSFTAQINRAKLYDSETDSKEIKKILTHMLRDEKNDEFQDQIYYVLADIAYKEKNTDLAIVYLSKSIKNSTSNNTQKALSYLKRADIYFERTDYKAAQANYDSTMTALPKDYPDYAEIEAKKKSLTSLVENLNVITLQDSLQVLSRMSEKDRNAAIDKLIIQVEENERKAEEEKQNELQALQLQQSQPLSSSSSSSGASSGSWYFYNSSTVSFGAGEFTKKWGSRKLEDNWRRIDKDQIIAVTPDDTPADSTDDKGNPVAVKKPTNNKKDRSYYLKAIPVTPEDIAKSDAKITDAYYNIGSIYKEQLLNNSKSVDAFEELLKRFPENKYTLSTYYQLYRTYLAMENEPKSDYYKNVLLKNYPESEYAKIIKNPDYAKDVMASKSQVEKFYTETYQFYSDGNYASALANCLAADTMYSKSYLMPQFAFVKALCIGRTQDINAFEDALTKVVIKYPKEPVKDKAQEILEVIKKQKNAISSLTGVAASDTTKLAAKSKFIFKEDGEYYWVTIVVNGKGDLNKFKTKLSDLNGQSFGLDNLEITSIFLDITHQMITVKTFDGKNKAMDYYNFMKGKPDAFKNLEAGTFQSFIISADNYMTFYKDKNVEAYQEFFTQNFK